MAGENSTHSFGQSLYERHQKQNVLQCPVDGFFIDDSLDLSYDFMKREISGFRKLLQNPTLCVAD